MGRGGEGMREDGEKDRCEGDIGVCRGAEMGERAGKVEVVGI